MFSRKKQPSTPHQNGDARPAADDRGKAKETEKEKKPEPPTKKIPVFFIDEAHKLYVNLAARVERRY